MALLKNRILPAALAIFIALCLCACSSNSGGSNNSDSSNSETSDENATQIEATVYHDSSASAVKMAASSDDFSKAGFELGDSCDVVFGNGYCLTDVPYYDGEYTSQDSDPFILASGKNEDIAIKRGNVDLWSYAELYSGCTAEVTLNTKGKYKETQDNKGAVSDSDDEISSEAETDSTIDLSTETDDTSTEATQDEATQTQTN